jgi:hypothetical protein
MDKENSAEPSFMRLFPLYGSPYCIIIALSPDRHLNPSLCRCATPRNGSEAAQEGVKMKRTKRTEVKEDSNGGPFSFQPGTF